MKRFTTNPFKYIFNKVKESVTYKQKEGKSIHTPTKSKIYRCIY